jgi:pimeloyl-ACP methyl ester carboxylesterase
LTSASALDRSTPPPDRRAPAWLTGLLADFLNLDEYLGKRVSEETVRNSWSAGAGASPYATWACVLTCLEDFHTDIERIDIPTLILHGTADRILSLEGQGRRLHAALPDARYVEIAGGPQVMCVPTRARSAASCPRSFRADQPGARHGPPTTSRPLFPTPCSSSPGRGR